MKIAATRPGLAFLVLALAALAIAAVYEGPRTFKASEVLKPSEIEGPHYKVAPAVPTEGYLYVFSITPDYGPLEAEGKSMLLVRLDEVSKSEVFLASAGTSVLNVGKGAAAAVTDHGATVKGIGGGLKRFGTTLGWAVKENMS